MKNYGLKTLLILQSINFINCEKCSAGTYATYLGTFFSGSTTDRPWLRSTQKIWIKGLVCNVDHTNINQCTHDGWGSVVGCTHAHDITIACQTGLSATADVRLVTVDHKYNIGYPFKLLEVFHDGEWGTVCSLGSNVYADQTVCQQLQIPNEPCISCATGTYSGRDATQCTACPRGTYAAIPGTSTCTSCEAGLFSSTDGTVNCIQCSSGTYSITRATSCTLCQIGNYSDVLGLSYCYLCPGGSYGTLTGLTQCAKCSSGTYSSEGVTSCANCLIGKYSNATGQSTCKQCTGGTFSTGIGATSELAGCPKCRLGKYSIVGGDSYCLSCVIGTFSSTLGATQCESCIGGSFGYLNEAISSLNCTSCIAGTYSTAYATSCEACTTGKYASTSGLSLCSVCGGGKFSNTAGASSCDSCAPGTYNLGSLSGCQPCEIGKYSTVVNAAACQGCPSGYYSKEFGATECLYCTAGTYTSYLGQQLNAIEIIYDLRYGTGTGSRFYFFSQEVCKQWPNHQDERWGCVAYEDDSATASAANAVISMCCSGAVRTDFPHTRLVNGNESCGRIEIYKDNSWSSLVYRSNYNYPINMDIANRLCKDMSPQKEPCKSCPSGTYQPKTGQTLCLLCPNKNVSIDYTFCRECGRGTYTTYTGSNLTVATTVLPIDDVPYISWNLLYESFDCTGQIRIEDCTKVYASYYSYAYRFELCCSGPTNEYHNFIRLQKYTNSCGYPQVFRNQQWYYFQTGSNAAVNTRVNNIICNQLSAPPAECQPCPPGSHQPYNGKTTCLLCPKGSYSQSTTNCDLCPSGTYSSADGTDLCVQCETGKYSTSFSGSSTCDLCSLGSFASYTASTTCSMCFRGTYTSELGSTQCIECEKGKFSSISSSISTCDTCSSGSFTSFTASTACRLCFVGTYSSYNGLTECIECDRGMYSSISSGSSTCFMCSAGTFASNRASSNCSICIQGAFSSSLGLSTCINCDSGKYANISGSSTCTLCTSGTYNTNTGSTYCTVCEPGTFSSSATSECKACISGKYSSRSSASANSTCQSCPTGKYASQTSSSMCLNCTEGQYASITDATACLTCLKGKYTKTPSLSTCDFCVAGSFASSISSSTCSSCARGTYSTTQGAETCTACERGKYTTHAPGATSFLSCIACGHGFFASELSSTICSICETGKYTSSVQTIICRWCEPGKFSSMIGSTSFASCVSCDKGYYNSAYSSSYCNMCSQGKYSSIKRNQKYEQCMACPAGKQTKLGTIAINSSQCVECSIGTYSQEGGTCQSCPQGTYSEKSGTSISDCSACPLGTTTPAFSTINTKIQNCSLCAKGFNQNSIRRINSTHVACEPCPKGAYNPLEASNCSLCSAGSFSRENGATQCILCEKGTYASASAQSECSLCPQSKPYSTMKGPTSSSSCKICPEGTFIDSTYIPQPSRNSIFVSLASYCDPFYETVNDLSTPCFIFHEKNISNYPNSILLKRQRGATKLGGDHYLAAVHLSTMNFDMFKLKISFTSNSIIDTSLQSTTLLEIWHVNGTCGYTSNNTLGIISVLSKENQSNSTPCQIKKTYGWDPSNAFLINESIPEIKSPILLVSWDRQDTFETVDKTEWTLNISIESRFPVLCQPCAVGKYTDQPDSFSCLNCTPGTFAASIGNSICRSCRTGEFSTSTYHNCTQCEAGKYFFNDTCQQCDAGKFTSSKGYTSCTQCAQGSYSSEIGRSYHCNAKCLATETAIASTSETQCTACQPGTFTRAILNTSTVNMSFLTSIFKFNDPSSHNTVITKNPQGKLSKVEPFNELRLLCAYIGIPGAYKIELDLMQFFKSQVWSLSAWRCTQQANTTNYFLYCTIIKTFGSDQGSQTIFQIFESNLFLLWENYASDVWVYFDTGSDILPDWTITYNVTFSNYTMCVDCPKGSFSTGTRESVCTTCPRGKHSQVNGAFSDFFCTECAEGLYNDYQAGDCFVCEEGQYSTSPEFCAACPVGKYNSESRKTTCSICQPGLYNNQIHQSTCLTCDKGSYSTALSGPTYCSICATGKYNTITGASTCATCPFIHSTTKACIWCKGGEEFQSSTSTCKRCNVGKFNAENSITLCTTCPRGKTHHSEMSSCTQCQPGYYENSSQCIPCTTTQEGSLFSNETMATSCMTCAKGYFAKALATACILCNIGTFFYNGACKECDKGTYTTKYGNAESNCVTCPRGFFSSTQTSCVACAQGYFSSIENGTSCVKCPMGKYSTFMGATDEYNDCVKYEFNETCQACQKCPGLSTPRSGTECLKGSSTDTTECECPSNYYFDGKTCIMCSKCLQNTTMIRFCEKGTKDRDRTICQCPSDFYGNGVVSCTPCPKCPPGKTQIMNTCKNIFTKEEDFQIKCI